MINTIQKKLLDAGYISNNIYDKAYRFEIHEFLKKQQSVQPNNILIASVDLFLKKYIENPSLKIKNKSAYFIRSVLNSVKELDVPNISFETKKATKDDILEIIFRIIYMATTPLDINDLSDISNPCIDSDWLSYNQFIDVEDEDYFTAINFMVRNKKRYEPIIERFIELNSIDDADFNFKDEISYLNEEIDLIGEDYV
ncbi:MAG: hypothetical protein RBS24_00055 [Bacilli bacterium]|nr:hypothetical protein [Bacilli bacterium]